MTEKDRPVMCSMMCFKHSEKSGNLAHEMLAPKGSALLRK